jgi:adenylosuccinate synthase
VTSSNPTIGGALLGTGLNSFNINEVIGITKAYVTRVGEGPFPTEEKNADGDRLRVNGNEFGSTTGRPRRCGWFDSELLRQAKRINGLTGIALTKIDVLSGFKKLRVAVGYELKGKKIDHFPSSMFGDVKPVYEELNGWDFDITKVTCLDELPSEAKTYINFLEKQTGVPIKIISVGPSRENTFLK